MSLLCVDYGKAKIGLAFSAGKIAEPFGVIRYEGIDSLLLKVKKIAEKENVEKLIVGISEGESGEEAKNFGKMLSSYLLLPVYFVDETLSTFDAQTLSIESGMKKKKRKQMEDAYAAALILQKYLDNLQD